MSQTPTSGENLNPRRGSQPGATPRPALGANGLGRLRSSLTSWHSCSPVSPPLHFQARPLEARRARGSEGRVCWSASLGVGWVRAQVLSKASSSFSGRCRWAHVEGTPQRCARIQEKERLLARGTVKVREQLGQRSRSREIVGRKGKLFRWLYPVPFLLFVQALGRP